MARGGFSERVREYRLEVEIPEQWIAIVPEEKQTVLKQILSQDPRPAYQKDSERVYGMEYAGMEIKFQVREQVLTVCEIKKIDI